MFRNHIKCRACNFGCTGAEGIKSAKPEKLIEVFDLGIQPLANSFCKQSDEHSGYAPLKVMFCTRCSLAQLSVTVRPEVLYRNYPYVTSPSTMMQEHFHTFISDISDESDGKDVLEIGSNDGRLLSVMQEYGYSVLGIDPAENLSASARSNGVPTHTGFFGEATATVLGQSDIVIARHVFCHVDDWHDFVRGLEAVSHTDTLICIEVPYVGDMLKHCEFDTIYHEHLSYLSIKAILALLENTKLCLHRIIRYPIHGGAILLMLRHRDLNAMPHSSVVEFEENITIDDWRSFSEEAHDQIGRLRATVRTFVAQGKRVAGLGASAKSTVWINACGFTRKDIAFIADTTPQKQWTTSPGSDIPVTDEGAILRDLPDYIVMWCWNFKSEALEKFSLARNKGVKFIIPVPRIEIV